MAAYLLDTNVSLRFLDSADAANQLTLEAVAGLMRRGDEPVITAQVLGWSLDRVKTGVDDLRTRFRMLEDIGQIFPTWLRLVSDGQVQGKQVHDARLAAVVLAHGNAHLLTFNVTDFRRYPGVIPVHPQELIPPSS